MKREASGRELSYLIVRADNEEQIEEASVQERAGFDTGLDPQELPGALRYIAEHGNIWLQQVVEDGVLRATGVIELISLEQALRFDPQAVGGDASSPLVVVVQNQETTFQDVRRFAEDKDVVYHHGIAMSRKGKGYGTLLLEHALNNTPGVQQKTVACFIDAVQTDGVSGDLQLAPNEGSFTVHLRAGFLLTGVVDQPVYDETITYYSFLRLREGSFQLALSGPNESNDSFVNLAEGSARETLRGVKDLTSQGFVGYRYNRETHIMRFHRIQTYPA